MMNLRTILASVAVFSLATVGAKAQQAATHTNVKTPSTIEVIVASEAGGSTDTLGRIAMVHWEKALEQLTGRDVATVIRNLPGAGTEIGATALAKAAPNGGAIGILNLPHVPLIEAARDPAFEPWLKAYTPLATNVVDPNVIILGKNSKYNSLKEAVDAAKAKPGSVIVGAQGPLSDDQLALYALEEATGANFTFIPFNGGAPANRALLGGEIDITIGNVFDYLQLAENAKAAAVFRSERYEMIPDVPTVNEAVGVNPGELAATRAFVGPADMPEDVRNLYREAFRIALASEAFQKEAKERNMTLVAPLVGDDLAKVMSAQQELVARLYPYFQKAGTNQ